MKVVVDNMNDAKKDKYIETTEKYDKPISIAFKIKGMGIHYYIYSC